MKYLVMILVIFSTSLSYATSGSETFIVVSKTDPGALATPNLLVHSMKQKPGMAQDKGTNQKGDPIQSFIRDESAMYSVALVPQTLVISGISFILFQNVGNTSILIYRGGDATNYRECRAGTDCEEGIR